MRKLQLLIRSGLILILAASVVTGYAQTFKVVHNFGSDGENLSGPHGALAQGRDGALYGRTNGHLSDGMESAYRITIKGKTTAFPNFGVVGNPPYNGGLTLSTPGTRFYRNHRCFLQWNSCKNL